MSSSKCSFACICGIFLPLNPSTTTVYARSAFYPSLRFTLSLQSAFYTQSAFYPWSAVCSPQSAVRSLRFTLTDYKNKELHLCSGLSKMLQILNLSIASEKIVIPPSCFQNFLPSPLFPPKNFNWPAKILLYPFLSPSSCGIHIECSLIRTQIYLSKPLNGWFTKHFPYIIWSWCIRIRRSLISNYNITKVNRALWLVS